jgi:hypothetical protein
VTSKRIQINEVKKSIYDSEMKVSNMEEKFSKEMKILNKNRNVKNENLDKSNKKHSG